MKLHTPEMMTPGWWLKNHELNFRYATAEGCMDSCKYHFDVEITEDGNVLTANHGSVIINNSGGQQSNWRDLMEILFGVECKLASNLAGKLFCPTTKKAIPVSRIKNNPTLWCDKEYGVAMFPRGITYHEPDGAPCREDNLKLAGKSASTIEYSFSNAKATSAFVERFKKICLEAMLRCALLELEPSSWLKDDVVYGWLKAVHSTSEIVDVQTADPTNEQLQALAFMGQQMLKEQYGKYMDYIKLMCADHYSSTYLEYKP